MVPAIHDLVGLLSHWHAHGVPSQGAVAANCETSSAAAVCASSLTSLLIVCIHIEANIHVLRLIHIVVNIITLSFNWRRIYIVVDFSELDGVCLWS